MSAENIDLKRAINNLKREERLRQITKELLEKFNTITSIQSREVIANFLCDASEENMLDLVTKCAIIEADVNKRMQESLKKTLEKMKT